MMCFPEVQEKAQNEIERVIGNERLPTLSDIDDLPYVRALTWEVLRWQPVAPLGNRAFDARDIIPSAESMVL